MGVTDAPLKGTIHRFDAVYPGASQAVHSGSASAQSAPFHANTNIIRVFATVDTWIAISVNPTALTDGSCVFLPEGILEYFGVARGSRLAAIQAGTGEGELYVTEGV